MQPLLQCLGLTTVFLTISIGFFSISVETDKDHKVQLSAGVSAGTNDLKASYKASKCVFNCQSAETDEVQLKHAIKTGKIEVSENQENKIEVKRVEDLTIYKKGIFNVKVGAKTPVYSNNQQALTNDILQVERKIKNRLMDLSQANTPNVPKKTLLPELNKTNVNSIQIRKNSLQGRSTLLTR